MLEGMQIRKFIFRFIAAAGLIAVPVFSASGQAGNSSAPAGATDASSLPDGPGKQIIQKSCLVCHGVSNITTKHASESDWSDTVSDMIGKGADISDDDANTLVKYLAAHFGPSSAPKPDAAAQPEAKPDASSDTVNVNKATAAELESKLGLTEAEASALIDYRKQKGDFKTMQDLSAVPGLDSDKIKNQQSKITF